MSNLTSLWTVVQIMNCREFYQYRTICTVISQKGRWYTLKRVHWIGILSQLNLKSDVFTSLNLV